MVCPWCSGVGRVHVGLGVQRCPVCHGTGRIHVPVKRG